MTHGTNAAREGERDSDPKLRIVAAGDSVLVAEFEARIDPAINARALSLAQALYSAGLSGIRDVVPTYRSVAVYFDPLRTRYDQLLEQVERLAVRAHGIKEAEEPPIAIPVCYGGAFGPDVEDVAHFAGCSVDEVVRLHYTRVYRVYMLGFMPGRAYLATVDPRIAMPRHKTPRLQVPAGSVGIAGPQTGFSAAEHPNGWRIIGRTAMKQFDLSRRDPFLFKPGDRVRFVPILEEELAASL